MKEMQMKKRNYRNMLGVMLTLFMMLPLTLGAKEVNLHGMLRSYAGASLLEGTLTKNEQTVDLSLEGWGDRTRILVNPYAYIGIGQEPELGIREAYIDVMFEHADVRIGKQAILWGQAEGAFITDIVSPRDLRSFILADFREIRKGIPAIKADFYAGGFSIEGIWVPQFVPSSLPPNDSLWMKEPSFVPDVPIQMNPAKMPSVSLKNSEVFGKIKYFGPVISWEVMGGYAWTDEAYVESITPGSPIQIDQSYGRHTVLGGSFSTSFGQTVLRGEAAIYLDKPFSVITPGAPVPSVSVENQHQVQALVGLDRAILGIEMSGQYILSYVHDHTDGMMEQGRKIKEFSHTMTFRLQETFLDDQLTAKFFAYVEMDPFNTLLRPSVSWSFEDGVSVEGGLELFIGDADGMFGRFQDNSMAYISLRWHF